MKLKLLLTAFVALLLGHFTAFGQITTAAIEGLITDPKGEPLIGATVKATHTPSGSLYGTTTREDGKFNLPNLRIGGPYTIEVTYVGYQSVTENNVILKLGQKLPLAIKMQNESVTIDGAEIVGDRSSIISKDRTGSELNLGRDRLENLPTISRSAADFYRLTPSSDGNSFAGRNGQFNNFSLDGAIFNNPFGLDAATPGGQADAQPVSLDAIEQITVSLAPYDVSQAGFTGAAVNAVTKSGTNEFHGSAFSFYRNQDLTGNTVAKQKIVVPTLNQTQFGFALGGPIIKNKLFFFINGESDKRQDQGTTAVAAASDRTGANVSRVSVVDLEAVSKALKDRFGYETGAYEGYLHQTNSTKGLAKLDFVLNKSNTITATYNFLDAFKQKPAHPSAIGRRGPDLTTLQFFNSGYQINNKIQSGIIEWRTLFGNRAANKMKFGYSQFKDSRDPFSAPFPVININKDGIRYIVAGHEPFSIFNRLNQRILQFNDNLNLYRGNHTITAGVSFERFEFDNSFNLNAYGGTFGPGFDNVGAFLDSVKTGRFDDEVAAARKTAADNGGEKGTAGKGWALAQTNVGQFALYLQDEWAINKKLTFTYGLRMDMPLYFNTAQKAKETQDRNCCYDPTITWYDEKGTAVKFDHTQLPKQVPLWSPRLGFNYDVAGDQSMQLRGGSGLFSGRLPFVWIGNQVANPNWFFFNMTSPTYKFPQVWRSNLGYDHKIGKNWVATVDLIYTKDVNASIVRNYGLKPPTGTLKGVDTRPIYTDKDKAVFTGLGFPIPVNGYVFTNSNLGYSFNATFQIQGSLTNSFFVMAAYNYLNAKDVSSVEAEISSDAYDRNPIVASANTPVLSPSLYGNKHRIIGSAYKIFEYGAKKQWKTTISAFFQYSNAGTNPNSNLGNFRYSYTYSGDINGDGSALNDLIFIPTDAQLTKMNFVSDAQRNAFRTYILQDKYLSDHRGQYAEKYGIVAPWYSQIDVRLLQDLRFGNSTSPNTLQLSFDILNFGNMLNSKWGVRQLPVNTQPVGVSVDGAGNPTYSFDTSLTKTYANNFGLLSRWQARVGLRYIF
jgi:hypothetical protein